MDGWTGGKRGGALLQSRSHVHQTISLFTRSWLFDTAVAPVAAVARLLRLLRCCCCRYLAEHALRLAQQQHEHDKLRAECGLLPPSARPSQTRRRGAGGAAPGAADTAAAAGWLHGALAVLCAADRGDEVVEMIRNKLRAADDVRRTNQVWTLGVTDRVLTSGVTRRVWMSGVTRRVWTS
eukprot:360624-Chlamydomonas_euryale.AAC.1